MKRFVELSHFGGSPRNVSFPQRLERARPDDAPLEGHEGPRGPPADEVPDDQGDGEAQRRRGEQGPAEDAHGFEATRGPRGQDAQASLDGPLADEPTQGRAPGPGGAHQRAGEVRGHEPFALPRLDAIDRHAALANRLDGRFLEG